MFLNLHIIPHSSSLFKTKQTIGNTFLFTYVARQILCIWKYCFCRFKSKRNAVWGLECGVRISTFICIYWPKLQTWLVLIFQQYQSEETEEIKLIVSEEGVYKRIRTWLGMSKTNCTNSTQSCDRWPSHYSSQFRFHMLEPKEIVVALSNLDSTKSTGDDLIPRKILKIDRFLMPWLTYTTSASNLVSGYCSGIKVIGYHCWRKIINRILRTIDLWQY